MLKATQIIFVFLRLSFAFSTLEEIKLVAFCYSKQEHCILGLPGVFRNRSFFTSVILGQNFGQYRTEKMLNKGKCGKIWAWVRRFGACSIVG